MAYNHNTSRRPALKQGALLSKIALAAVVIFLLWLIVSTYRQANAQSPAPVAHDDTEALSRVTLPAGTPAVDIDYEGFSVSFNPVSHLPNYVVWELTADEARADRTSRASSQFRTDPDVEGCATPDDYRGSGYDRGHMAPAADMKWSKQAMDDCHLLTNIVPQTHQLNSGPWQTVEKNCRNWAKRDSAIIIICGPVLTDRLTRTIGPGQVPVPERFFKVVMAPYANPPRGIAFIMSNYDVAGGAQAMAVSIDDVEELTGMDFFSTLPADTQAQIESQSNYQLWQRLKHR